MGFPVTHEITVGTSTSSSQATFTTGLLASCQYVGCLLIPETGVDALDPAEILTANNGTGVMTFTPFQAGIGVGVKCLVIPSKNLALDPSIAAINTNTDSKVAGKCQVKPTTFELNQSAIARTVYTGTTQDVVLDSLIARNLTDMTGGNTTSFSIQTDDTTPQVIILATTAVKAALTVGAQFFSTDPVIIKAGTHIQLKINGAACGATDVMTIIATYHAATSGGYLA
jgi:hypothetical protein